MSQSKPLHVDFASRFNMACDKSEVIPPIRHGKLQKIVNLFAELFDEKITIETPRKWQEGMAIPRGRRMIQLAQILNVSPEWLEHGLRSGGEALGGHLSEETGGDPAALFLLSVARLAQGHAAIPYGKPGVNIALRMGFDDVEGYATHAKKVGNDLAFYIPAAAQEKVVFPVICEGNTMRFFAVPAGRCEGGFSRLTNELKVKLSLKDAHELTGPNAQLPFAA